MLQDSTLTALSRVLTARRRLSLQFESTARGFLTVASNDSHFYLLYGQPAEKYWVDIADGLNDTQRSLLMGGSVSAWGDEYCYIAYCSAYALFFILFPRARWPHFRCFVLG